MRHPFRAAPVVLFGGLLAGALAAGCQGGCTPKPQPDPAPRPPAPPTPPPPPPAPPAPAAVAGFVIVEDTAAAGQARGMFLASPKVTAFLKNSGLKHAVVSTNATDPDGKPVGGTLGALVADARAKAALPHLYLLDAAGKTLKELPCPLDPDAFVRAFAPKQQHPRAMGMIAAKPRLKWAVYGTTPQTPMIPRAQWKEVDLEAYLPPVHDQDGRGQCNASATCTALEASREIAGLSYAYLSAGDLYGQINGGRDQGSTLEDGLAAAVGSGVATAATVPYVWDGRDHGRDARVQAERRNYRAVEVYLCPTVDHMASALQMGFVIVEGLAWYDNYTPDSDGWLPTRGRGGSGGHALCGYGLAQRNGSWGIKTRNSWGVTWGNGGNCIIPESLFDGQISGYWAIRSVTRTPEPFPPATTARRAKLELPAGDLFQLAP
jgi:hypothetical protein